MNRSTAVLALFGALALSGAVQADSSVTFGYDQTGRVSSAAYDNGLCVVYAYDQAGNRTAQSFVMSSTSAQQYWGSGVWGCYLKWTSR